MKKTLIFSALIAIALFLWACGSKEQSQSVKNSQVESTEAKSTNTTIKEKATAATETQLENRKGKLIYKKYCITCHGADGALALSGATDLSKSTLPLEERIVQITNGKGVMAPYKDILSEGQIKAVAQYIEVLRK